MSSQYDVYWQNKLDEISQLLKEAYKNGQSSELDVSDIQIHGERVNWNGYVVVSKNGLRKGDTAHAKSLGKILRSNKLLDLYGDTEFKIKISNSLKLNIVRMDVKKPISSVPTQPSGKETASASGAGIETTNILNEELYAEMMASPLIGYGQHTQIPTSSGVYTAWLEGKERCLYVGKAGVGKTSNLHTRIRSHFSGRRGGDQFCVYVYDSYIHDMRCRSNTNLTSKQVDKRTGDWIRNHVKFRYVEMSKQEISQAEKFLQKKLRPILNPLEEG